ncbi:DUF7217 family protein [Marinomonas gallaica]|uniref:DUF7217 family protein n=1 Tax=Marinomonas gallaica TaxID=1806667 RepID=UPI003CE5C6E9
MLSFDKAIYSAIGINEPFKASSNFQLVLSSSTALNLSETLSKYLIEPDDPNVSRPNQAVVKNCQGALTGYNAQCDLLVAHIDRRLETLVDDLQVAKAVREIELYMNGSSSIISDMNITLGDTANTLLASAMDCINDQIFPGISDYDSGVIIENEFNDVLYNARATFVAITADLQAMIESELALLDSLYKTHRKMGQAYAIESLINDPSTSNILRTFASGDMWAALN